METFKEGCIVTCDGEVLVKFTVAPNVLLVATEDVVWNKNIFFEVEFSDRFSSYKVEDDLNCVAFTKVEFIGKRGVCVIVKRDFDIIISVVVELTGATILGGI